MVVVTKTTAIVKIILWHDKCGRCASSNWYDIKYLTVFTHTLVNVIHGTGGFIPFPALTLL